MVLGSTQPLVKMSTTNIPGGKGGRCVRLTTSPPSCAECHEIWEPKCPGTLWVTPGLLRDCYTCTFNNALTYTSNPHYTGLFISPWNILKIRNKQTTQRIMVVLTPIERETLKVFFLNISRMLNMSTFGNTEDIYAIFHLVPHACQHITVDQSHSSGDTVAKILAI